MYIKHIVYIHSANNGLYKGMCSVAQYILDDTWTNITFYVLIYFNLFLYFERVYSCIRYIK